MKLYGYWRSSATYRVRIAFALKGARYDYVPVNLLKDEQNAPDYLKIAPLGLVPTLVTDGGAALNQSTAIIEFLEETIPTPPLLPGDPVLRARSRAIAATIACEAQPFGNLRMMNYLRKEHRFTDEQATAWMNLWPGGALKAVDRMARDVAGQFCVGDAPTMADVYLVPQLYAARRFKIDLSECRTLLAVEENCAKLEAFKGAHPDNQPDAVKS
jgi:maleylacetoacetate isomerase/maleylpyruvate isomerase